MSTNPGARQGLGIASLFSRSSLIVGLALLALAALAWRWLWGQAGMAPDPAGQADTMGAMAGMAMPPQPLSPAYLGPAFAMWFVMMIAMMIPAAAPVILLHARILRTANAAERALESLAFVATYLLIWAGFSLLAAFLQAILLQAGVLESTGLVLGSRVPVAGLLSAAAIYEMTAAKRQCLERCQSPLLFIHRYWRPGLSGALRLGVVHGLYCLGCCWLLMLLLFAGGVMNLAWVAVLCLIVIAEKLAPPAWHGERWIAGLLFGGAAWVLLG